MIRLDVAHNTAPVLTVPADLTVEGDTTGGWTATYGVTATDAQDDPDPTPTCVAGRRRPPALGPTTVACSVTDIGGLIDQRHVRRHGRGHDRPGHRPAHDVQVTTADPAGAVVTYDPPTAVDVVDRARPSAACRPAEDLPGRHDDRHLHRDRRQRQRAGSTFAFTVDVTFAGPHVADASSGRAGRRRDRERSSPTAAGPCRSRSTSPSTA